MRIKNFFKGSIKPKGEKMAVARKLKAILWSKNINAIDSEVDRVYVIHQVLAYGDIDEIKLLLKTYSLEEIKDVFLNFPKKIYTKPVFLFIKNYLLKINKQIDEQYYVKSYSRHIK